MQLLNNKDTDWKQENNRRNQPWNLITSSDPQTGYSCLQELGLRLFIMTSCHFSFSKSNGISEKQRQNRHNSNWLQEECEKVPSSTRLKKSCSQFVRLPRAPELGVCIVSHSQTASTRRWRVTVAIFGWTFTSPSIWLPCLSTAAPFLAFIPRRRAWRTAVDNCKSQPTCYAAKMKCLLFLQKGPLQWAAGVISNFTFHTSID